MQYWRPSKDRLIVIDDSKEGAGQLIDCQRQMGGYTPTGREHALVYMSCSSVTKEQREAIDRLWEATSICKVPNGYPFAGSSQEGTGSP